MTKQNNSRFILIYNAILVVSIIIAGISLISGALVIYFSGDGYSRKIISETFLKICIPIFISILLIIGNFFIKSNNTTKFKRPENFNQNKESKISSKNALTIKLCIVILAVASLLIGVLTGGLNDVLTKAVNICTECIGLG